MRIRKTDPAAASIIFDGDVITYKSEPTWLASGHSLRRTQCTICGELISGNAMRIIIALPMMVCTCPHPEIHSIAYLVCARHKHPNDMAIVSAAAAGRVLDPGRQS